MHLLRTTFGGGDASKESKIGSRKKIVPAARRILRIGLSRLLRLRSSSVEAVHIRQQGLKKTHQHCSSCSGVYIVVFSIAQFYFTFNFLTASSMRTFPVLPGIWPRPLPVQIKNTHGAVKFTQEKTLFERSNMCVRKMPFLVKLHVHKPTNLSDVGVN